jgi:hypothetical protein
MIVGPMLFLLNVLVLPLGVIMMVLSRMVGAAGRRPGLCGQCGYDLRGQPIHPATCPECGTREDAIIRRSIALRHLRAMLLAAALAAITTVLLVDVAVIATLVHFSWSTSDP